MAQAQTSTKDHDSAKPAAAQKSGGAAPVQGGGALDGLTKLLATSPTPAQVAAYVGKQSATDQKTLLTWMQTAPGLGSAYASSIGKLLATPAAPAAPAAPTGTAPTKIPAPAPTKVTGTGTTKTTTGTGTTTAGGTTKGGGTAAPVLGTTASTSGDVTTGDFSGQIASTGTNLTGTASFGEKVSDPSQISTSGDSSSSSGSGSSSGSSATTTAPKTPTTTLSASAGGSATIGSTKVTGAGTVTDKEGVVSGKGSLGVNAGNTTVTVDGGAAEGTKASENGGLQVVQKVGDDTITGGIEVTNNDAETTTKGTGKKATTTTTPDNTSILLNGGLKTKDVNVTGTGGFNSTTDDVNVGSTVGFGNWTLGGTYDNLKGDSTIGFNGSYTGKDATVSDTFSDDLGKDKITDTASVKITKGDLAGDTVSQGVTDNAGDFSSTAKLGVALGANNKFGTGSISGTADYGKNTYGGSVGYTAPTTSVFAGTSVAANGSLDPTAGMTQGVNTSYRHQEANGGMVTGSNTLNYFNTGQPTNDHGSIDYHHSINKSTNVDVGAEVQVGPNYNNGYEADVYGGVSHTNKGGSTVSGMAAVGVSNGIPYGGVGGGWDSKSVDVDGQPKNSIHGAVMMGALGPVAGVAGEIEGKVRFKVVMQDLQVVELSVSIPGKHPVINAALNVATTAAMIGIDGVGFAIGGLEKLFGRGHIPGIDRLLQTVHGDKSAKITDANGTTDSAAAAALSKSAAILTEEDLQALVDMHMVDAAGNIDGTIAPDLFNARLNASPLDATQKGAISIAYKAASAKKKHAKTSKKSGVADINNEIQQKNTDPNQFAALLEKYPRDWTPMLEEIAHADGYGVAFANQTAKAAGILDQVVVAPDGTVNFALPLPSSTIKPSTPPPTPPATQTAPATTPTTDEDSGTEDQLEMKDLF